MACKEADTVLAISAINNGQFQTSRAAAAVFNVSKCRIRRRRAGKPAQCDCIPNSKKLTKYKEEAITQYIINLDARGFRPSLSAVRNIANKLLVERKGSQVGK
jgi:hypothetical protein